VNKPVGNILFPPLCKIMWTSSDGVQPGSDLPVCGSVFSLPVRRERDSIYDLIPV
jgi:hypothetical protein